MKIEKENIPTGLMQERKALLLKAGFQPMAQGIVSNLPLIASPKEETISEEKPLSQHISKLTHLTKSRPVITGRQLPSKHSHRFFANNIQNQPNSEAENLIIELKEAIKTARQKYKNAYEQGGDSRFPNGWFTKLRHNDEGQDRAQKFCNSAAATNQLDQLLDALQDLFNNPITAFNNHSFATLVFEELYRVLIKHALTAVKPNANELYTKEHWGPMKKAILDCYPIPSCNDNTPTL